MKKIIIIAGNVRSLVDNRGDLIEELKSKDYEVQAIVPKSDFNRSIEQLNIKYHKIDMSRQGMNPINDFKTTRQLIKILKKEKPEIVLSYTIKPVIFGSIAARISKVESIYSMITGLGYIYTGNTRKQKMLKFISNNLYKISLKFNEKVFLQNFDDHAYFTKKGLIKDGQGIKINGSGVNINRFPFEENNVSDELNILMIGRLIRDKGINEYIEVAQHFKENYNQQVKVNFHLLGSLDQNPNSLSEEDLNNLIERNIITYHNFTKDVRSHIKKCNLLILPSYREGTPRVVLEAQSMGRPVITTDAPGCRETVLDNHNGFLVPTKNSSAIITKINEFINNPQLLKTMGENARQFILEKYDVRLVNRDIITAFEEEK